MSSLGIILLIVFVLMFAGAYPGWPHASHWGYYPFGGVGLIVLIVVILILAGRL